MQKRVPANRKKSRSASREKLAWKRLCNICGETKFATLGLRSDGVQVLRCTRCGMGVLEELPPDPNLFYGDDYYGFEPHAADGIGYDDYAFTAEHGVSWAAALVNLLKRGGRILDIGCADGSLLKKLGPAFDPHGIEVNIEMSCRAERHGVKIIGNDIFTPEIERRYAGAFDIVTCVAAFEHLFDFRKGVETSLSLLKDDGVLLFEVPLLSETNDNSVWFKSSLEHIYYPTEKALRWLVQTELKSELIGSEIVIRGFASTYIGIIPKQAKDAPRLRALYARLTDERGHPQSSSEKAARLLLLLVHAAASSKELVGYLPEVPPESVSTHMLKRLEQLWKADLQHGQVAIAERAALIEARDWHVAKLQGAVATQQAELGRTQRLETQCLQLTARIEDLCRELTASQAYSEDQARNAEAFRVYAAALSVDLAEREAELTRLGAAYGRLEGELASATSDHKLNMTNAIAAMSTEAAELRVAITQLQSERDAARNEMDGLKNSTTWKIACTFRLFGSGIQVLTRAIRRLRKLSRRSLRARKRDASRRRPLARASHLPPLKLSPVTGIIPRSVTDDPEPWPLDRPMVSVVIPCFNYGHFVEEAVDSILAQTFQDLEIIVVEGGSTSLQSRLKVANLSKPKTKVVFQDRPTLTGANRNFGISHARGKYICCLDADDRLMPTYIEKMVFLLEHYDYDVVSSCLQFFGNRSDRIGILERPNLGLLLKANHVLTCALFRRALWVCSGGFRDTDPETTGYVWEDWAFWTRLAACGARFFNVSNEALFLYRNHDLGLSSKPEIMPLEHHRALIREMNEDLLQKGLRQTIPALERRKSPREPAPSQSREPASQEGGRSLGGPHRPPVSHSRWSGTTSQLGRSAFDHEKVARDHRHFAPLRRSAWRYDELVRGLDSRDLSSAPLSCSGALG